LRDDSSDRRILPQMMATALQAAWQMRWAPTLAPVPHRRL